MRYLILLPATTVLLCSCGPNDRSATISLEQFQEIQWIEGKWRGTWAGSMPFFESYRMIDDSTIAQTTWSDSTFTNATDSSLISLRNGRVTNGSAMATKWDAFSVHFEPKDPKANSYTWQRDSVDMWTARIPVSEMLERVYVMRRIPE